MYCRFCFYSGSEKVSLHIHDVGFSHNDHDKTEIQEMIQHPKIIHTKSAVQVHENVAAALTAIYDSGGRSGQAQASCDFN